MINESNLREILEEILLPPIILYSIKVIQKKSHYLIEINLDNLEHFYGSVSLGDCEAISHTLHKALDERFPNENYTLQVSSAGAEREIKIPGDLERFKNLPMKIRFVDENGLEKAEVVHFISQKEGVFEFQSYAGKRKNTKEKLKKSFFLTLKDIKKGNLYLDY